jgi:hypothetical protein
VRDLAVRDGDVLEDEWIGAAIVVANPVDADYERALSGYDELVGTYSFVTRSPRRPFLLLLEDRPGLIGALSAWSLAPPEKAALDASPDRVRREQARERLGIALVERRVGGADRGKRR